MGTRTVDGRYQHVAVAEAYDDARFGGLRGRYNNWRVRRLVTRIVRSLGPENVILDVPCGTGRLDDCFTRASRRLIAADISKPMLAVAQRKLAPAARSRLVQADVRELPLRSRSVDVVFCIRYLHLLNRARRRETLDELERVTRRWVVVEYRSVTKPLRAVKQMIRRWAGAEVRTTTVADVVDELREAGLFTERTYFISRWFSGSVLILARTMLCALALLVGASVADAQPPSLTASDAAPVLTAQGRSLDPARHDDSEIVQGLKILGDDFLYLITAPLRPTVEGVAITAGIGAGIGITMAFDRDVRDAAGHHRHDRLGTAADAVSQLGNAPVLLGLNVAALTLTDINARLGGDPRHFENALVATEAQILAVVLSEGIGYATARSTPRQSGSPFDFHVGRSSFPSSHTTQAFAVATVVADRYGPAAGAVAYTLATGVGAARIIQERHWASDVVAGAALGWAIGYTLSLRRAEHPPFLDFFPFADPGTKTYGLIGTARF